MTKEEAKTIFLNRGYIELDGGSYFDGDKWRESIFVISKWLKEEPCTDTLDKIRDEDEIDFILPKNIIGKLISIDVLDKIEEEIKKEINYWNEQIDYGNSNEGMCFNEAYCKCINIIDKYKKKVRDKR